MMPPPLRAAFCRLSYTLLEPLEALPAHALGAQSSLRRLGVHSGHYPRKGHRGRWQERGSSVRAAAGRPARCGARHVATAPVAASAGGGDIDSAGGGRGGGSSVRRPRFTWWRSIDDFGWRPPRGFGTVADRRDPVRMPFSTSSASSRSNSRFSLCRRTRCAAALHLSRPS